MNNMDGTSAAAKTTDPWRSWMRELGLKMRMSREALGISQADLALAAGVSQGAISRLETGRGLATPLLVVLKTAIALQDAGRLRGPEAMPKETAPLVDSLVRHVGNGGRFRESHLVADPGAVELVATFRSLSDDGRRKLLETARSITAEFASQGRPCHAGYRTSPGNLG